MVSLSFFRPTHRHPDRLHLALEPGSPNRTTDIPTYRHHIQNDTDLVETTTCSDVPPPRSGHQDFRPVHVPFVQIRDTSPEDRTSETGSSARSHTKDADPQTLSFQTLNRFLNFQALPSAFPKGSSVCVCTVLISRPAFVQPIQHRR